MVFKTFFIKNIMMNFFISVTCISIGMAILGIIFQPDVELNYYALIYPHFYGIISSLLILIKYSRRELSTKELLLRDVIHFVVLEATILFFVAYASEGTDALLLVSIGIMVFVIYMIAHLVSWINDRNTAKMFNQGLSRMQESN